MSKPVLHEPGVAIGRRIFDRSPIGMALVSPQGVIALANPAFGAFLGYRARQLVGTSVRTITHPDDRRATARLMGRIWSSGKAIRRLEKRYLHKSGRVVWGEVNACLPRDRPDESDYALVQVIDITERKQAEEALRQSEKTYKALADNAPDLVVRFDRKFRHLYISPAVETVTGVPPQRYIGKTNKDLGVPERLDRLGRLALREVFRTGCTKTIDYGMETSSGARFYQSRMAPEFAPDGSVHGVVCITRDITERRSLEAALERSRSELEDKVKERTVRLRALAQELTHSEQRERRRIAYVLHEDLQQILAAIKVRICSLRQGLTEDSLRRNADLALNLLDTSVAVTRNLCIDLRPPVLYELGLSAALDWMAGDMRDKLGLRVDVKADKRADFTCDDMRTFAFTAIRELVMNVGKHAGVKAASVRVKSPRADRIAIEVCDKGAGFDVKREQGQKFGLFSIRERANALGGRLDIDSRAGRGTRATLLLPVR